MVQLLKLSKNDLKKIIYRYNYHTKIKNYRYMTKKELKHEILKRLMYEDGRFFILPNEEYVELPIKKDRWGNITTQDIAGDDAEDDNDKKDGAEVEPFKTKSQNMNANLDEKTLEILNAEKIPTRRTEKQLRANIDEKLENKLKKFKAELAKSKETKKPEVKAKAEPKPKPTTPQTQNKEIDPKKWLK